jgi:hypothetical protein
MVIVDTNRIPKDLREVAREAEKKFEWYVVARKKNGYLMSSPGKTKTFYIPFKTNNAHLEAKKFRMAMAEAALTEGGTIQEIAEKALTDSEIVIQVVCDDCAQTFMSMEGYRAHRCPGGSTAPVRGGNDVVDSVLLGPVSVAPERHTDPAIDDGEPMRGSFGSGSMSNKEEAMVVKGEKRGTYRKSAKVQPGLARVIYEVIRDTPQWKSEAASAYANRVADKVAAKVPEQVPVEAAEAPVQAVQSASNEEVAALATELAEAREKLAKITEVLGIDVSLITEAQELRETNRILKENVGALKDLFEGIKDL